jgi:hypothetical protein
MTAVLAAPQSKLADKLLESGSLVGLASNAGENLAVSRHSF